MMLLKGNKATILVGGEKLDGRWVLVELATIDATHNPETFAKTAYYPEDKNGKTLNDRDYEHDKQAQAIVIEMSLKFDGRAINYDDHIIITPSGYVISGNNRVMSAKRAAKQGLYDNYLNRLEECAGLYGFSADDIQGQDVPLLVFMMREPEFIDTALFAKFNRSTKKAMNPLETAVKLGKTLDGAAAVGLIAKIIDEKETLGEIYQSSICCQRIMSILIEQKIITELDAPQFITDNGLTAAGKDFIETFLIASFVYEDNLRRLTLDGGKCIRQKIVRASIGLACNGACVGYSIYREFNAALDIALCAALDKNVKTIDCYIK